MPLDYLRELAQRPLPQTITDEREMDKLRVLDAAGCVEARIPETPPVIAVVIALTDKGRLTLEAGKGQNKTPPAQASGSTVRTGRAGDNCC